MKEINDNNIDDIMFRLLEGEIRGEERRRLLEAIESDEAYSKLWKAWQHTILEPDTSIKGMDLSSLKKKGGRIVPFHFKYAIAAMVVLGLGIAVFINSRQEPDKQVQADHNSPYTRKNPVEVPKPKPAPSANNSEDTVVTLREKIKTIAGGHHKNTRSVPPPPAPEVKVPETPIMPEPAIIVKKEPEQPVKTPTIDRKENELAAADNIIVSVTSTVMPGAKAPESKRASFLSRLFGNPSIEIQKDSSLVTNRRLVIKNKQFQILAGY